MDPKVMIILGSASDLSIAEKTIAILELLKIPYSLKVASAHRTHEKVKKIAIESTKQGIDVFIAIAGLAAHLPGSIAAYTHKPVIGVPVDVKLNGMDALLSSVQTSFPVPIATVGIDRGENAGILAGEIIGMSDVNVQNRIAKLRETYKNKVNDDDEKLNNFLDGKYFKKNFISDILSNEKNREEKIEKKEIKNEIHENKEFPLISIVVDSYLNMEICEKASEILDKIGISYDIEVISPLKEAEKLQNHVKSMNGVKLFLAIGGLSAHITGSIVALSEKPVIGVPCPNQLYGLDSLISMVNMPPGVPVATVGIDNSENAAILACEVLGTSDEDIESKLKSFRSATPKQSQ